MFIIIFNSSVIRSLPTFSYDLFKAKRLIFFSHYTPGIYAEGYIVFVFPFVCSFVRSFVRTSFRRVEFASKFCVKVSQVVYISATTHQKAFIFGP